jgi:hypothetical protein
VEPSGGAAAAAAAAASDYEAADLLSQGMWQGPQRELMAPLPEWQYEDDAVGEVDAEVQAQTAEWLQQLAMLLPATRPGDPPRFIALGELRQRLPVPESIIQYHGGIHQFVDATPGIHWSGPKKCIGNALAWTQRCTGTCAKGPVMRQDQRGSAGGHQTPLTLLQKAK